MRAREDKIANGKTLEIKQWIWVLKAGQELTFFFTFIYIHNLSLYVSLSLVFFIFFLSILTIHFVCCLFSGVFLFKQIYVLGHPCICWTVRKHPPWYLYCAFSCIPFRYHPWRRDTIKNGRETLFNTSQSQALPIILETFFSS